MQEQDTLTGRHAVRVYTLDGIKDGHADFDGNGPVRVHTLDGTVRIIIPRMLAVRKINAKAVIYSC